VPAEWASIQNLFYLGLHGNPELCRGTACLDVLHSNWTTLKMVSVSGWRCYCCWWWC
jgi:hypothetical protein